MARPEAGATSGGQQQRVALARAIVRNPVVYLMDEPLSNLDAQLRVQTRAELKRLQQDLGTTTIHVTHDQAEAMTLGHRVAILRRGRIEQVGAPLELYRKPVNRFVAEFLGSPAINMWPGELDRSGEVESAGTRLAVSPAQRAALSRASRFEVGRAVRRHPGADRAGRRVVGGPSPDFGASRQRNVRDTDDQRSSARGSRRGRIPGSAGGRDLVLDRRRTCVVLRRGLGSEAGLMGMRQEFAAAVDIGRRAE